MTFFYYHMKPIKSEQRCQRYSLEQFKEIEKASGTESLDIATFIRKSALDRAREINKK